MTEGDGGGGGLARHRPASQWEAADGAIYCLPAAACLGAHNGLSHRDVLFRVRCRAGFRGSREMLEGDAGE
jgi:hypothetical protein